MTPAPVRLAPDGPSAYRVVMPVPELPPHIREELLRTIAGGGPRIERVELEGRVRYGIFSLAAGGTYTDAEIVRDATDPTIAGNRPQRQAKFVYQATPQVDLGAFSIGANVIGTTASFTQPVNQLKMPGYTQVNGFLSVRAAPGVTLNLNGNNLFNVKGITEAEDAAIPANGIVRARSINGRTISASARFDF